MLLRLRKCICLFFVFYTRVLTAGNLKSSLPVNLLQKIDKSADNDSFKNKSVESHHRVRRSIIEGCVCGIEGSMNLRVMGGVEARKHEFPWQALLVTVGGTPFCGGTLINDLFVLTAAHCVYTYKPGDILIQLGDHDIFRSDDAPSQQIGVRKIIVFPGYSKRKRMHDIALIELLSNVTFSAYIRPPCFPTFDTDYTGFWAVVSGWGAAHEGGKITPTLHKVSLPVLPRQECQIFYGANAIHESVMCAGFPQGGKDACQGDSGGPMVWLNGLRYVLIGVVSWGLGCGRAHAPGIYTRVDHYLAWINDRTRDANFC